MEQVLWETILKDAFPDLLLVNRETLVSKVEIGLHLGHSNNKAIQFKISFDRRKRKNLNSRYGESRLKSSWGISK